MRSRFRKCLNPAVVCIAKASNKANPAVQFEQKRTPPDQPKSTSRMVRSLAQWRMGPSMPTPIQSRASGQLWAEELFQAHGFDNCCHLLGCTIREGTHLPSQRFDCKHRAPHTFATQRVRVQLTLGARFVGVRQPLLEHQQSLSPPLPAHHRGTAQAKRCSTSGDKNGIALTGDLGAHLVQPMTWTFTVACNVRQFMVVSGRGIQHLTSCASTQTPRRALSTLEWHHH